VESQLLVSHLGLLAVVEQRNMSYNICWGDWVKTWGYVDWLVKENIQILLHNSLTADKPTSS